MKNHLLKIISLSILCFSLLSTSCSESDSNNNSEEETMEEVSQETPEEETPEEEIVLTDVCMFCPPYQIEQSSVSNPVPVIITEPEANVCKGEDGKAYLDGVLNEDSLSYEKYLEIRQMILRCSDL